jgi:hypothetical protein
MNKKILVISILAAALMIMLPLSSVVGTNVVKSDKENVGSPLFAIRHRSKNTIQSEYLGKGKTLSLFIEKKMTYAHAFDKTISMLQRNPGLFNKILEKIQAHPKTLDILKENDISITDFESYANMFKNNPGLLEQEIKKVEQYIPDETSLPLGMNTTNPFAIIILIMIVLPIILTIGIMIATMTILTCFNFNNCFENLMQSMIDNFIQGLTQPDT